MMGLKELGFVPYNLTRGKWQSLVQEFYQTGNDCMGKSYESEEEYRLQNDVYGINAAAKRLNLPVRAGRRDGWLYLKRTDTNDSAHS